MYSILILEFDPGIVSAIHLNHSKSGNEIPGPLVLPKL